MRHVKRRTGHVIPTGSDPGYAGSMADRDKRLSLQPLTFEEALTALAETGPSPKEPVEAEQADEGRTSDEATNRDAGE
jgi:hypothetical protein